MNLAELGSLMAKHGPTGTLADVAREAEKAVTMAEAMAQRMVTVPASFDYPGRASECACGLLLVELPTSTPVSVKRTVLVLGTPHQQLIPLTHAHIAPGLCLECVGTDTPCAHHPAVMCDTPTPELCGRCSKTVAPLGKELCAPCARVAELMECGETFAETVRADRMYDAD